MTPIDVIPIAAILLFLFVIIVMAWRHIQGRRIADYGIIFAPKEAWPEGFARDYERHAHSAERQGKTLPDNDLIRFAREWVDEHFESARAWEKTRKIA